MPLDFQRIYQEIKKIGAGALARQADLDERRALALDWLSAHAGRLKELGEKVERARAYDHALRCALPAGENLDARHPLPEPAPATLIAADGSQIAPDRHAPARYALVNLGAVVLADGADPAVSTQSELTFDQDCADWTDGYVALRRDLAERARLLELAKDAPAPVITLTDGPLQLWESRESGDAVMDFSQALERYLSVLSQLQSIGATTAGYVDKPASDTLVRLLEVAATPEPELETIADRHPLAGVSDRWLLGRLLAPGERSAVFALQSKSKDTYTGALALHFFYLNVGREGRPWTVRVEVPAWVADDPARLDGLHAALIAQCRILGSRPYPYILHRAHETAVIKPDERAQLEQMLLLELRRRGAETDEASYKQSAKDLPGRSTR